jgi:hypothetical protein
MNYPTPAVDNSIRSSSSSPDGLRRTTTQHSLHVSHLMANTAPSAPIAPPPPLSLSTPSSSIDMTLMTPAAADFASRRSISDSVLRSGQVIQYDNKNTLYMMVNRSGGSTVRQIVAAIHQQCDLNGQPPEEECCVLAQWAADVYYRVVIAGKQGIPAIVRAMATFPYHAGLQECCCLALGNLCLQSPTNVMTIGQLGGVHSIVTAMKLHSTSVAVQSAACDALRNMSDLILSWPATENPVVGLMDALSHAKDMYLHPTHRSIAELLLRAIQHKSSSALSA